MTLVYRPVAEALPNGLVAVYCGGHYNDLPRHAAIDLMRQLGEALGLASTHHLEFLSWAAQLHALPTRDQVMERFGVSRAMAYRLIAAERTRRQSCTSAR
jgi:hypothetical protein